MAYASDRSLEKDLQRSLEQNRVTTKKAKDKAKRGESAKAEIDQLRNEAKNIRALQLLLDDKFRVREEEVKGLGQKAIDRHKAMVENYREGIEEYLSLIKGIPSDGEGLKTLIEELDALHDKIIHKKKRPLLGSLPYRNLNYPSREPNADPAIKPAYKGGDRAVSPDDLQGTSEAPVSGEIAGLAQLLSWNPVLIYEYVKNTIETEWYWGCMKGAEETLRQKSGNDCDQASLLLALLRASGFPSRYVRGAIEFFATDGRPLEKVKNLLGIDDPWKIAEFFQKAGIPYKPVIAGGGIANFQIEHLWVESQIPYANYRGAVIDEYGKTWLGLDTSIKVKGYQYNSPLDILPEVSLSNVRDEYLDVFRGQTPQEYTRGKIEAYLAQEYPGKTYADLLRTRTLIPEVMNILPASMQFEQRRITHEYTELPDELKHKVQFIATDRNKGELFSITLSTMSLSNKQVTLTHEPETIEDQQIIDSYGGLDNTPAYLVRLRPVLRVDGERVVVARDGLPMGADYNLTIELLSPGVIEGITTTHIAGNLSVIGIVSQKVLQPEPIPSDDKDAAQIFYEEAMNYSGRWNEAEQELASLLHLTYTRPLPTVTTVAGVIDVTYVLDTPHGYEWKGVYVDANKRAVETIPRNGSSVSGRQRQKTFMELSALQGSVLENRIFEDDWQVESVSTGKLAGLANSNRVPMLTIDSATSDTLIPTLSCDDDILEDIWNSVNQGLTVTIPLSEITYRDWTGIGYIKENPETGESGYMLSGMIAGGMTAVAPYRWVSDKLATVLGRPNATGPKTITILILSPVNGVTINKPTATVRGKVLTQATEVWIKVNGRGAEIYGNQFIANNIPLVDGSNVIRVEATDSDGTAAVASVTVEAIASGPHITLTANITSGIPPVTPYFSLWTEVANAITEYQMDFEGDGVVDYKGSVFDDMSHTYTAEGIYYPTVTAIDDQGNVYQDTIAVTVLNKTRVDDLLKRKWEGMKRRLADKDVEGGLSYFSESSKDTYRQALNIILGELPQIVRDMGDIEMIYLMGNVAKYRISRTQSIDGTFLPITYYIYFGRDADGIWKIEKF